MPLGAPELGWSLKLWPRTGAERWTRKVLVVGHPEELTRAFVVSLTGIADRALLTQIYALRQIYASLRFKPVGRWELKITHSS